MPSSGERRYEFVHEDAQKAYVILNLLRMGFRLNTSTDLSPAFQRQLHLPHGVSVHIAEIIFENQRASGKCIQQYHGTQADGMFLSPLLQSLAPVAVIDDSDTDARTRPYTPGTVQNVPTRRFDRQ
jgi:hypothetical protein